MGGIQGMGDIPVSMGDWVWRKGCAVETWNKNWRG